MVLSRLNIPVQGAELLPLPSGGRCRANNENYFKGLTAEHRVTRYKNGRAVEVWELKDPAFKRNEPFDLRNYATAALEISNPPGLEVPGEEVPKPARPRRRQSRRRLSGGFDMAIISKELAEKHLILWLKAEAACAAGQSYQIRTDDPDKGKPEADKGRDRVLVREGRRG